jgi:hypothetical protein
MLKHNLNIKKLHCRRMKPGYELVLGYFLEWVKLCSSLTKKKKSFDILEI